MITMIDANGRVQLPLKIRHWLEINPGDKLAVGWLGDGTIILKKLEGDGELAEAERSDARTDGAVPG
jgi:AbrB family looped-hinge helix DNA binding protein